MVNTDLKLWLVSEWLLLNAKWLIFQLSHSENQLHFDEILMMAALY
jgi:hypothetical protein